MPRTTQTSFTAGEIAPELYGRVDLARYTQGVALARNFYPKVYGGLCNRPGTRYVAHTKGDAATRLLPFQRSTQESAILQFADGSLRWIVDGAQVTADPTDATVSNGGFDLSLAGWTDQSTGLAHQQGAGSVLMVDPSVGTPIGSMTANGGLGAAFDGAYDQPSSRAAARLATTTASLGKGWGGAGPKKLGRVRLNPTPDNGFQSGTAQWFTLRIEGSSDGFAADLHTLFNGSLQDDQGDVDIDAAAGLDVSTAYAYHRVRFFPGTLRSVYVSEVEFWEITSGNGSLQLVGDVTGTAATEQAITTTHLGQEHVLAVRVVGTQGQSVQVQIGGSSGATGILPPTTLLPGWHLVPFTPGVSPFYVRFLNPNTYTVAIDDVAILGSGASAPVPLELAHDYREAELRALYYAESVDVVTIVHPAHPPRELRRLGVRTWSLVDTVFQPTQQPPTGLGVTKVGSGTGTTWQYVVTASAANGEESLPTASVSQVHQALDATHANTLTWTAAPGATQYSVYKYRNGLYGLIGSTAVLTFTDDGINPNLATTPPAARNPFDVAEHYPDAVGFYEGREIYGGSLAAPDTFEMSKAASYRNFSKSVPTQSDDAITATLSSEELNQIVAFAQLGSFLVFTTGAYWRVDRGQNGLTPQLDGGVKMQAAIGAAPLRPIVVGHAGLFVTDKAQGVRSVSYDWSSDTFQGDELSTTSKHLFTGHQVLEWAFQRTPWPMLWLIRDDGVMLSLSYLPEQQVTGWAQHDTRGQFESVACVSEGTEHAVYVVARRLVGGTWRRFVERFASRAVPDIRDAYHVDCGVTVDAPCTITAMTLASPLAVTAPGHGCAVGDLAGIDGLLPDPYPGLRKDGTRLPDLAATANGKLYLVAGVAGDVLTLADRYDVAAAIDASAWPAWRGGGSLRKAVASVAGLDHLEGETVAILADGSTQEPRAVAGGSIVLDTPAARVHIGLPYLCDIQTLAMALPPDQYGSKKSVTEVLIQVSGSRGLLCGPSFGDLVEQPQRDQEQWNEPTRPLTGHVRITTPSTWSDGAQICIRQPEPLPLEVLSIVPEIGVGS